jgi:hypothetical protein
MDCKKLKQLYYDACSNNYDNIYSKNTYYQKRDHCKENKELYVLCCLDNQDNTNLIINTNLKHK